MSDYLRPLFELLDTIDARKLQQKSDYLRSRLGNSSRAIDYLRNRTTATARLPNELLCRIFFFALDESARSRGPTLCTITRICRRWRSVAIDDPSLWSSIHVFFTAEATIERAFVFLERSKGASIQLHLEALSPKITDSSRMMELMDELALNGDSIARFTIGSASFGPEIQEKLQFSVPNLESLRFQLDTNRSDKISFQPSLFGGRIPNLKCLDLTGTYTWPPGLFNNLKEITLRPTQQQCVKGSSFFELLQASPGLHTLIVTEIGSEEDIIEYDQSIPLLQLQYLSIEISDSELILSRLVLPASVFVVLNDCVYTDGDFAEEYYYTEDKRTILSSLPTQCSGLHFLDEIPSLKFTTEGRALKMVASNKDTNITIIQATSFLSGEEHSFTRKSWSAVMKHTALHSITCLEIISLALYHGQDPNPAVEDWVVWLECLNKLRQFKCYLSGRQHFLEALSGSHGSGKGVPCPELADVEIAAREQRRGRGPLDVDPTVLKTVVDFAQARENAGRRLKRLGVKLVASSQRHGCWEEMLQQFADVVRIFQG